jgi:hypothetical protein
MKSDSNELRLLCVQGFCKIVFNRILDDRNILALLIIEFFTPQSGQFEDTHDCLSAFFSAFAQSKENISFLYEALVIAIKAIMKDRGASTSKFHSPTIGMIKIPEMVTFFCGISIDATEKKQSHLLFALELLQILYHTREVCCLVSSSLSFAGLIVSSAKNLLQFWFHWILRRLHPAWRLKRSSSVTISPKYLSILRTTNLERRTL